MSQLVHATVLQETRKSFLNVNDVLFILLRHKWKIFVCAFFGIAGAAALHFFIPSVYESRAKLLVRYVVDRGSIDQVEVPAATLTETTINSEVEILTSEDLAAQVAVAVGVDRLTRQGRDEKSAEAAARNILRALTVAPVKGTNIISVSYRNRDPKVAELVLQNLVTLYFDKHLEVHRSAGAFGFVTREVNQMGDQLRQTEETLKQLKDQAGVISLGETTTTLNEELVKGREELDTAQAELATQQARVKEIEKSLAGSGKRDSDNTREPDSEVIRQYQALVTRVAFLHQAETELLSRYTAQNQLVKAKRAQIDGVEKQEKGLEQKYPTLVGWLPSAPSQQGNRIDLGTERAQVAGLAARVQALTTRLASLEQRAKTLSDLGPQIAELQRKKEAEETSYKYYQASLEKARVDETLDPKRMPNISVVQKPSEAVPAGVDLKHKILIGLAAAGVAFGTAMAFAIELFFDRTVRRRLDLETQLGIPLLLSIPDFGRHPQLPLPAHNGANGSLKALSENSTSEIAAPWENDHFIRPFCQTIRDRLILYFERNQMTHKPKLVAVTGCSDGAGASTIAAGVAAALSETCNGRVLFVDKPMDPRRFFSLIADSKEGDFDYVIFDMPSISDTGTTLAMASLMDKVLLVVEAEVSSRDVVKRAYAELAGAKANVSAVFNKSRTYGPKWMTDQF